MNTETVTEFTKCAKVQATQNPRMEKEKWAQNPTLDKKLFETDICWGEKSVFLNGVKLGTTATFQSRPHAPECLVNTNCPHWLLCAFA